MNISKTLHVEELDDTTREYLLRVRESRGRGMPGIFVPKNYYLPAVGCFFGIAILIGTAILAWQVMEHEPLGVAMLETAGALLGGWMILAAIRVWLAGKSSSYAGHFVYSDAQTLYECKGAYVVVTDVHDVVEASSTQNFAQGKYQNTAIRVRTAYGSHSLTVANEDRAKLLLHFLNVVAWMRAGDDGPAEWKQLPAALVGGAAREHAWHGAFPRDLSAATLDLDVSEVPIPRKEGRASSSLLWYLIIMGAGVGGVFAFRELNVSWRDEKIWNLVNDIPTPDDRAWVLRLYYLNDARNTKHRDAARQMLLGIYRDDVARIRRNESVVVPGGGPAFPAFNLPGNNQTKVEESQLDGLAEVLYALVDKPLPIVSVSVKEAGGFNGGDPAARAKKVREQYTKAIVDGVGDKLVMIAESPPDVLGNIHVSYEAAPARKQVVFKVEYRTTPDEAPVKTATTVITSTGDPASDLGETARQLGLRTAGRSK